MATPFAMIPHFLNRDVLLHTRCARALPNAMVGELSETLTILLPYGLSGACQ